MENSCRVLLVPFPITPLTAFAFFLYRKFGLVTDDVYVRYRKAPGGENQPLRFGNGVVWNLSSRNLYTELDELIAQYATGDRRILKRLLTFCQSGDPAKRLLLARWIIECFFAFDHPRPVLEEARGYFSHCVDKGIDLWEREPLVLPRVPLAYKPSFPVLPDKRIFTLPVFKSQEPGETEVIASARCELREGRVWELRSSHIGIMIGGPARSGKSTLATSLVTEFLNQIQSLATRIGWAGFSLDVECVDLDLATPTTEAIWMARDGRLLDTSALKRPWTTELALEGLRRFAVTKEQAHLTFVDLPGGPIDAITETLAALADVAILVTHDWERMEEWQRLVNQMGITLVSQARSRRGDEGFSSVVTRYHPGRIIAGRVVDLDRVVRSDDPFVLGAAWCLLYDILPSFVSGRRQRLEHLRSELL